MAKKTAKTPRKKPATPPRARSLPGMEDARIAALEDAAGDYADIRDQRIALNVDEGKFKDRTLRLMRQHGKTVYKRDGIEIRIEAGEDDVKVRVRKPKDETETVAISNG